MSESLIPSDIFVILPSENNINNLIFAKNSHRPKDEVQEVVYFKGGEREAKLKCTYIEIDDTNGIINSVFLSKPAWSWGAEMGANDKNVVIGNYAVRSLYNDGDADVSTPRLQSGDFVRIGLEKGSSAEESLEVITGLLKKYGQGGSWTENESGAFYHSCFIIADANEAWVLETCGKFWAAQKVSSGHQHFSNGYVIHTNIDRMSENLTEHAKSLNLWNGEDEFDFSKCFSGSTGSNKTNLLDGLTNKGAIIASDIFELLRDKENDICHISDAEYPTQASFVSFISDSTPSQHWFTGTPDPSVSVYKPFIFTPNARVTPYTVSSTADPKHQHQLYTLHSKQDFNQSTELLQLLRDMENKCVLELATNLEAGIASPEDFDELMKDCVETEVKFYR